MLGGTYFPPVDVEAAGADGAFPPNSSSPKAGASAEERKSKYSYIPHGNRSSDGRTGGKTGKRVFVRTVLREMTSFAETARNLAGS